MMTRRKLLKALAAAPLAAVAVVKAAPQMLGGYPIQGIRRAGTLKFKMNFGEDQYRVSFPDGNCWEFKGYVVPVGTPGALVFDTDQGQFNILARGPATFNEGEPQREGHGTMLVINGTRAVELKDITAPTLDRSRWPEDDSDCDHPMGDK